MTKTFEYRGDLSQTTLPEMLYSINRFQVPGVIEARNDGVTKKVFIRGGHVVHATSSDLGDSLGSYLLEAEELSKAEFQRTMQARESTNKRYGALLVEEKILSPAQVYDAILKQVEAIVWSLFYWLDGEVSFSIGDFSTGGMVRIQLPMSQVILSGIKQAPNAKALVARLGNKETVFEPCFQTEDLVGIALDAEEYAMLRLVDGKRTLYEVCTAGPGTAADNAKLMYAFKVLRLVQRCEQADGAGRDPGSGKIVIKMNTADDPSA